MMKYIKQAAALLITAALLLSAIACGKNDSSADADNSAGLANPVVEVASSEELAEKTGIGLAAPEGAENVTYSYIQTESPIAQVNFALDGEEYCYRAQPTSILSLFGDASSDVVADTEKVTEMGKELTGLNDEFENGASDMVGTAEAFCSWTEGKSGFVIWLDVVPGIMYSLSMSDGASREKLLTVADETFVPAQGDVNGYEAGTYTSSYDGSTLTINEDGTVQIDLYRLTSMDGKVTGSDNGLLSITAVDANGADMGLTFDCATHELKVTDSQWDLMANGDTFSFD